MGCISEKVLNARFPYRRQAAAMLFTKGKN